MTEKRKTSARDKATVVEIVLLIGVLALLGLLMLIVIASM